MCDRRQTVADVARGSVARGAEGLFMSWFVRFASRLRVDGLLALLDACLVAVAFAAALLLRVNGTVPAEMWARLLDFLPLAALVTVGSNWAWGLYGQVWEHASVLEARRLICATVTTMSCLLVINGFVWYVVPHAVPVLGGAISAFLAGSVRFHSRLFSLKRRGVGPHSRVILLGAGEAGALLVREMVFDRSVEPVAFLDDDPRNHGRRLLGIEVLGDLDALVAVASRLAADQVVLAVPSASAELVRRAADLADRADLPLLVLPTMADLVNPRPGMRDLREVRIDDLLGRAQVNTDLATVQDAVAGRRVLITGAGGSIGSEIARQIDSLGPAALLLLDNDETHLHDCAQRLVGPSTQLLCDIRSADVMRRIFDRHQPDVVYHAAALKHVPLLEDYPDEAVRTNVIGTRNVVEAAAAVGVRSLVLVSTDKAVEPSSVMGMSKWLAEQVVLDLAPPGAAWSAVRFGNVLGSRGSVVPTFTRQIAAGGPVTVTDAAMTRFFMSIPEAVQLVLQAGALSTGGEIFILDMGEPVSILDLAKRMIRLSGRRPGTDVEIRVIGTRPGEKMYEKLQRRSEQSAPTAHPSLTQLRPCLLGHEALTGALDQLHLLTELGQREEVAALLRELASDPLPATLPAQGGETDLGSHQPSIDLRDLVETALGPPEEQSRTTFAEGQPWS